MTQDLNKEKGLNESVEELASRKMTKYLIQLVNAVKNVVNSRTDE